VTATAIATPVSTNTARHQAVRERANVAFFAAKRAWFRSRSQELGGYTARTRDQIDAESIAKGHEAAIAVFLDAGYRRCWNAGCDRVTTPIYDKFGRQNGNYPLCPACEAKQSQARWG
jgi:hypothetical protein